jgi:hypothetical protein
MKSSPAVRSAAIYALEDRILLHPWQRTTEGLEIASEPYVCVPADVDAERLGEVVLGVLSAPGQILPHPTSWKGLAKPRLEAAGVKSESAFMLGTRSVAVEWLNEGLRFEATRNGGSHGPEKGFHPLPHSSVSVDAHADARTIGAAVKSALSLCR